MVSLISNINRFGLLSASFANKRTRIKRGGKNDAHIVCRSVAIVKDELASIRCLRHATIEIDKLRACISNGNER